MKIDARTDLIVVAAGKGSRMASHLPKSLIKLDDSTTVAMRLVEQTKSKFDNIYIVASREKLFEWHAFKQECEKRDIRNVVILYINSGLGTGHALIQACKQLKSSHFTDISERNVVVCWGDVILPNSEIIDELLKKIEFDMVLSNSQTLHGYVPVKMEANPYVTVLTDHNGHATGVDSSKLGEVHMNGFHDMSIFAYSGKTMVDALTSLHCAYWKNGSYITPDGELHLTQTFHYLHNRGMGMRVYETLSDTYSFNTQEELNTILKLLEEEK